MKKKLLNKILKYLSNIRCYCKSSCCSSECYQSPSDSVPDASPSLDWSSVEKSSSVRSAPM